MELSFTPRKRRGANERAKATRGSPTTKSLRMWINTIFENRFQYLLVARVREKNIDTCSFRPGYFPSLETKITTVVVTSSTTSTFKLGLGSLTSFLYFVEMQRNYVCHISPLSAVIFHNFQHNTPLPSLVNRDQCNLHRLLNAH